MWRFLSASMRELDFPKRYSGGYHAPRADGYSDLLVLTKTGGEQATSTASEEHWATSTAGSCEPRPHIKVPEAAHGEHPMVGGNRLLPDEERIKKIFFLSLLCIFLFLLSALLKFLPTPS